MRKFAKQGGVKKAIAKRRSSQSKKQLTANRKQEQRIRRENARAEGEHAIGRTLEKKIRSKAADKQRRSNSADEDDTKMDEFAGMSVDDFMSGKFLESGNDSDSSEDDEASGSADGSKEKTSKHADKVAKNTSVRESDGNSSSSDSDSDDEDVSSGKHKAELEELKKTDPEFAQFLAENDPSALGFDSDESEDKGEAGSDSEEEDDDDAEMAIGSQSQHSQKGSSIILTPAKLRVLIESALDKKSVNGTREIIRAFASATHMTDTDASVAVTYKYAITNSTVYNDLMFAVVSRLHETLGKLLHVKATQSTSPVTAKNLPSSHSRWPNLKNAVKSFLKNFLHLISQVTDTNMLVMMFKNLEHYTSYAACYPALPKKFLRQLLKVWSTTSKKELRLVSFLCIRRLALNTPFPFIEQCMKGLYLSFVRNAKVMNDQSRSAVAMMAKCIVELAGLDMVAAYQHAFVYIRQLAIHLRNAIKNKSKDSYAAVFNWQFMNCLMVWSAVISTYPGEKQLKALVYPLVQIIIGTVNLVSAAKYFPMRFHCTDLLNKLSAATGGTLIPVPSLLLDVLRCPEFGKLAASTRRPPRLEYSVKVSSKDIQTKGYQDSCVSRALELLEHHFQIHKWSIAYPELAHSTVAALRKFSRDSPVARWRQQCKAVVSRIDRQVQLVQDKRSVVAFGPKDLEKAKAFMASEATGAHRVYLEQQAKQQEESIEKSERMGVSKEDEGKKPGKKKGKKRKHRENEERKDKDTEVVKKGKHSKVSKKQEQEEIEDDAMIDGEDEDEDVVQDMMLSDDSESD